MKKQQGQIGLVVLLLMTALLTLGVGAVTQSTSDLRDTRQETDASLAFNQAEAGVEIALGRLEESSGAVFDFVNSGDSVFSDSFVNTNTGTEVTYRIEKVNTITNLRLKENETAEVAIQSPIAVSDPVNLYLNWSEPNTALEVMFFIEDAGVVSVQRHALRRNNLASTSKYPGFIDVADGNTYEFTISPIKNSLKLVRIRAIGGDTDFTVTTNGWTLPVQAYRITSTAQQQNSNEVKVIELTKSIEALPSIFDFALFSGETITM